MSLYAEWIAAKQEEANAIDKRRSIEDRLVKELGIPDSLDGTDTFDVDGYKVKVTGRMNRKVDGDKLQQLAAEAGLSDHLPKLFRWKPELNLTVWKQTNEAITAPLLGAITTTPGRPSFAITAQEE